jgi:hypothetical protein
MVRPKINGEGRHPRKRSPEDAGIITLAAMGVANWSSWSRQLRYA